MSSQATSTRANQRAVARFRNVVASTGTERGRAPDDDAEDPEEQDPQALSVEGDADPPQHEDAQRQGDLEPPPPDDECHPGVGAEGLDGDGAQTPCRRR